MNRRVVLPIRGGKFGVYEVDPKGNLGKQLGRYDTEAEATAAQKD